MRQTETSAAKEGRIQERVVHLPSLLLCVVGARERESKGCGPVTTLFQKWFVVGRPRNGTTRTTERINHEPAGDEGVGCVRLERNDQLFEGPPKEATTNRKSTGGSRCVLALLALLACLLICLRLLACLLGSRKLSLASGGFGTAPQFHFRICLGQNSDVAPSQQGVQTHNPSNTQGAWLPNSRKDAQPGGEIDQPTCEERGVMRRAWSGANIQEHFVPCSTR